MFSTLTKPATTLTAFILLYTSSLQVVKAVPASGVPRLQTIDCANEPPDSIVKENALDAQDMNSIFDMMDEDDPCQDGEIGCIDSQFAECTSSKWSLTPCMSGRSCFALPLYDEPGMVITCESPSNAASIFDATCVNGGPYGSLFARHNEDDDCNDPSDGPGGGGGGGGGGDDNSGGGSGGGSGDDSGDDCNSEPDPSPSGSYNDPSMTVTTTLPMTPSGNDMYGGLPTQTLARRDSLVDIMPEVTPFVPSSTKPSLSTGVISFSSN